MPKTHCVHGHSRVPENLTKGGNCRSCKRERQRTVGNSEAARGYRARWRENNPNWHRVHHLMRMYGLTPEQFDAMLITQSGRCAICNDPMQSPHVDHCHETGKVRALLCSLCNQGLGQFRDRIDILREAVRYLAEQES